MLASCKPSGGKDLAIASDSVYTHGCNDSGLERLVSAWPLLPPHIREAISTLVDASDVLNASGKARL